MKKKEKVVNTNYRNRKFFGSIKAKIKLASPETIEGWAHGCITESETLNYRTLKPINGGLFCAQIFGPVNDYECSCKRYKGYKYEGIICERCNVQVMSSNSRRERMGYIALPFKVVHPWFFRNNNKISALIDISLKDLKKIANLEKYIVFSPGNTSNLKKGDLLNQNEYETHLFVDGFSAETGAIAIETLLKEVNVDAKIQHAKDMLKKSPSSLVQKKYKMIIELCEGMKNADVRPEWMILSRISVIPPDIRPLMEIEGGKFVSADINELYRTVIYRVKRLESLVKNQIIIPLILHNEIRMLQDAINKLFGFGGENEQKDVKKYKSLEERIKGKEGSFRKSMLGKREDFSGRTVIVGNPNIQLDECILPREMMLEILKPSVIGHLILYGLSTSVKQAKRIIENKKPEVWDILNEIVNSKFPLVLLNRAPTLHRIGIMAFKIKLWDKKCLGIHPLVCPAFNADFDGDQMAVHLPLSEESKAEAWELMRPTKNLGSVTHGNLIVGAFKDIALGIYYLTLCNGNKKDIYVNSIGKLELLMMQKVVHLNDQIKYCFYNNGSYEVFDTTAGRVFFWSIIPKNKEITFASVNKELTSQDVHDLMKKVRFFCGDDALSKFSDDVKDYGFKYANLHTGSIGTADFFDVSEASEIVKTSIEKQIKLNTLCEDGLITFNEMRKKSDDLWKKTTSKGKDILEAKIKENPFNPAVLIVKSGARGSIRQMLQILFMKGNVTDITGDFSVIPIWKGHKEGLTMDQYALLSFGARKGVADVALRTAESGYLTRRLVDVAHDCMITDIDCETKNYIIAKNIFRKGVLQSLVLDKVLKRVTAMDIKNPLNNKLLVAKGTLINESTIEILKKHEITEIAVRSPALCELSRGICAYCYGGDLSSISSLVNLGEAVGVIAAQSIGEPGTQLTMKSFHSGGVAQFGFVETSAKTPFAGYISYENSRIIKNPEGEDINISRDFKVYIKNKNGLIVADFDIPYGAKMLVKEEDWIESDSVFAVWKEDTPIIAEFEGKVKFINLQKGLNCEEITEDLTGERKKIVIPHKQSPSFILTGKDGFDQVYFLPHNTVLNVNEGESVKAGQFIAYTLRQTVAVDIVGGLQKVIAILENRPPSKIAKLSSVDGVVRIQNDKKGRNIVIVTDKDGVDHEFSVDDSSLAVQNNQKVKKGDLLTTGTPLMQDILDYRGEVALIDTFVKELQNIYLENGLKINDKHLEVILHQMCRRFEIFSDCNTNYAGRVMDRFEIDKINTTLVSKHKQKIEGRQIINGITNAALESISFLSSASFQETINVLTWSGLVGAEDDLQSLKSSTIAGTLLKAGTGYAYEILNKIAENYLEDNPEDQEIA